MQLLPVIDVLRGIVVRGVGGRRDEYQPLTSRLCAEPSLTAVAAGFRAVGLEQIYLADLDAIGGAPLEAAHAGHAYCVYEACVDSGIAAAAATPRCLLHVARCLPDD